MYKAPENLAFEYERQETEHEIINLPDLYQQLNELLFNLTPGKPSKGKQNIVQISCYNDKEGRGNSPFDHACVYIGARIVGGKKYVVADSGLILPRQGKASYSIAVPRTLKGIEEEEKEREGIIMRIDETEEFALLPPRLEKIIKRLIP